MPIPVSLTTISMCELTRSTRTCTRPSFDVNLTAFDSRFHTTCCRRSGSPETGPTRGSTIVCRRMPFASAAGCTVATALWTMSGSSTGLHVETDLARDDPGDVEHVLDDLGQRGGIALERLEPALGLLADEHPTAQQPGVPDDRVQRRAELVRQHREELVLQPIGLAGLDIQPRVLERDRGPCGNTRGQLLVLLGEHARP